MAIFLLVVVCIFGIVLVVKLEAENKVLLDALSTHFPLNTAALCEDCHEVGSDLRCCACCGSRSLMALAPLLNRAEEPSAYETERVTWVLEQEFR